MSDGYITRGIWLGVFWPLTMVGNAQAASPQTVGEALSLIQALRLLGCPDQAQNIQCPQRVLKVDGHDQIVQEPYYLDPELRWNAGLDLTRLEPIAQAYEKWRRDMIRSLSGGSGILKSDSPNGQKMLDGDADIRAKPIAEAFPSIKADDLAPLKKSGLNLEPKDGHPGNPIPSAVLAGLAPVIDANK